MGTRFECVLGSIARAQIGADPLAAALAEAAESIVTDEHHRLSIFDPSSALSLVNRLAARQPVIIDDDLFALLSRCLAYTRDTEGAFDITAGSLMASFGFRAGPSPEPAACGCAHIQLDETSNSVRLSHPGVQLDFGAIAKGYALDLARDALFDQGVTSALLQGGTSSVIAIGHAPDAAPWRVRLMSDDPESPTIDLTDRALACSSPAGRTVDGHGHIMDTRTGRPATGTDAACVVGPSAEICEVWSTALAVDPDLIDSLPAGYDAHLQRSGAWQSSNRPTPRTTRPEAPLHA